MKHKFNILGAITIVFFAVLVSACDAAAASTDSSVATTKIPPAVGVTFTKGLTTTANQVTVAFTEVTAADLTNVVDASGSQLTPDNLKYEVYYKEVATRAEADPTADALTVGTTQYTTTTLEGAKPADFTLTLTIKKRYAFLVKTINKTDTASFSTKVYKVITEDFMPPRIESYGVTQEATLTNGQFRAGARFPATSAYADKYKADGSGDALTATDLTVKLYFTKGANGTAEVFPNPTYIKEFANIPASTGTENLYTEIFTDNFESGVAYGVAVETFNGDVSIRSIGFARMLAP